MTSDCRAAGKLDLVRLSLFGLSLIANVWQLTTGTKQRSAAPYTTHRYDPRQSHAFSRHTENTRRRRGSPFRRSDERIPGARIAMTVESKALPAAWAVFDTHHVLWVETWTREYPPAVLATLCHGRRRRRRRNGRKLKIIEHISLDSVIQAPGGPTGSF